MDATIDINTLGFRVEFRLERGCLMADVTGWIETIDALIAMFLQVGAELRRTGLNRLLVIDHTRGVVPPEHELRKLMSAVEGHGFGSVRLAYVDARGTAVSRMEVGEILAREHGYACRIFDNEQVARIWLSYGEG